MKKFIRPAQDGASILDPERGRDLPAGGVDCKWTPYWARMELRGDVKVSKAREPDEDEAESEAPAAAAPASAPAAAKPRS